MSLIKLGEEFRLRDSRQVRLRAVQANIDRISAELQSAQESDDRPTQVRLERDLACAEHAYERINREGQIVRALTDALTDTPKGIMSTPCPKS